MIQVVKHGILLEKSEHYFESQAVLNPGCLLEGDILHMVYRAVAPGNYSSIGYAQFKSNQLVYRSPEPILKIERAVEQHGLEDPRLVFCEGLYYLFYVSYDGTNAQVMYATATSLPHFSKQSLISSRVPYEEIAAECAGGELPSRYEYFCSYQRSPFAPGVLLWEKDSFIFPRKIQGKFAMLYRLLPEIQVISFDNFAQLTTQYWLDNFIHLEENTVLAPKFSYENQFIGGGCPPLETEAGWLLIYHTVSEENGVRLYQAGAALLDVNAPTKVLGRLPYPLFSPEESWEKQGDVANVVFPSGAVIQDGQLVIYYGAADSCIAYCSINLGDLIQELHNNPVT